MMNATLPDHRSSSASNAAKNSSPSTPNIISDSDESSWSLDEEENGMERGGFFHCLYPDAQRSSIFKTVEDEMLSITSDNMQIQENHSLKKGFCGVKNDIVDLGTTHVLTSDESSMKESSMSSNGETDSSFEYRNTTDGTKCTKLIPYLVFTPSKESSLIGTEVVFQQVMKCDPVPNLDEEVMRSSNVMTSTISMDRCQDDIYSPPSTRSLMRCTTGPFITLQTSPHYLGGDSTEDNDFLVCPIMSDHTLNLPSHNKALSLSLCPVDQDPELALNPKINFDATEVVLETSINTVEPNLPSLQIEQIIVDSKMQQPVWRQKLFSFCGRKDVTTHITEQLFEFPAGFWQLERKRTQRERVYMALIMISIMVLVTLGIIILIQQFS
jgi:hypothetical protein